MDKGTTLLGKDCIFSALDANSGYGQAKNDKCDREETTLVGRHGL